MHEVSLFENVAAPVEQKRRKQTFTRVNRIQLKVGALGCIQPDQLRFCFDPVTRGASPSGLAERPDFTRRGANRLAPSARDSLCWPHDVAACGSTLAIADSGKNRVLLWESAP
jgi:hypothetical protein